ncbi:MAG: hypothetical protein Q8T11_06670 [Elusimicrobiota bacterium]|nr:hypothetical protein [Elusimicrobiota bacterium]
MRLNLILLAAAVAASLFARRERDRIDIEFTRVFRESAAGPIELDQITAELAEMDLAEGNLAKELESRLAYAGSLKSDFYLSIDTARKTLALKSGNDVVRETAVRIGAQAAAKGSFAVAGMEKDAILLPGDRVIQSGPGGPRSFMVSQADLKAIRIHVTPETRVYVF